MHATVLHAHLILLHMIILINLLATDFFFSNFSTPVFKMWIIQKPNKVALWNKQNFEEKKMGITQHVKNIQYGYLLNNNKMGHLEGNFTPVLYMGLKVPKGWHVTIVQITNYLNTQFSAATC